MTNPAYQPNDIMATLTVDTLPDAILLEVCTYLDLVDVVALSEVSKALRTLALTRTSFWLRAMSQSRLFIALPTHRALNSFTASELSVASHRAILSERNILSSNPKLRSWTHVTWPYPPAPGVEEQAAKVAWEGAEDAIHMHLSHPNAEWMFTVSSRNILRILHLRTGQLALAYDGDRYDNIHQEDEDYVFPRLAWAVEFREETVSSLVMNCFLRKDNRWRPAIRMFHVHFDPKRCTATMEHVGYYMVEELPAHLDIAGGYIIASGPGTDIYDGGAVKMIRWKDMQTIALPPLWPSVRIAAFQEYFVSVGVTPFKSVGVQVVGYPQDDLCERAFTPDREADTTLDLLVNRSSSSSPTSPVLPLHSYILPFEGPLMHYGVPFACHICHFYTGEFDSNMKVWVRLGRSGVWSVYSIDVDLVELRSSTIRLNTGRALDGEPTSFTRVVQHEYRRVMEESDLRHWAAPTASGRRFLWWRPIHDGNRNMIAPPLPPSSNPTATVTGGGGGAADDNNPVGGGDGGGGGDTTNENIANATEENEVEGPPARKETFRLCTAVIDNLASFQQVSSELKWGRSYLDPLVQHAEGSVKAKQVLASRMMEVPYELATMDNRVYMFVMEEWCGTILVQMYSGDLWVLRYGKA